MLGVVELIIIFAISWWLVFLPTLGIGTHSQDESGVVTPGTEAGAPTEHDLPRKAVWATKGAAIITLTAAIVIPIAR